MSIRKAIAQQLSKASKALEEDQSKEKISLILTAARVGIANAIMPKISTINSWSVQAGNQVQTLV